MLWRHVLVKAVVSLILIGLLVAGGIALYRMAWSQGYATGRLAASGQGVVPESGDLFLFYYGPRPFLGGLGLFFALGLLFLGFLILARLLSFGAWQTAGQPRAMHWVRHGHWPHGPLPSWCWERERPAGEKAAPTASRAGGEESKAPGGSEAGKQGGH